MAATNLAYTGNPTGIKARMVPVLEFLGRFPLAILQLLFRLAVASVFLKAAMTKLASWEFTIQLFADEYKVPVLRRRLPRYLPRRLSSSAPVC